MLLSCFDYTTKVRCFLCGVRTNKSEGFGGCPYGGL
nr:MAG TPA: DNA-directed RNA polymerase [Caudoviricetes sp.]